MKACDLSIGDSFPLRGDRYAVVTDIQDTVIHNTTYDKPKRTIKFDIYTTGLFPEKIGWSFYVFFEVNTDMSVFSDPVSDSFFDDDDDDDIV